MSARGECRDCGEPLGERETGRCDRCREQVNAALFAMMQEAMRVRQERMLAMRQFVESLRVRKRGTEAPHDRA